MKQTRVVKKTVFRGPSGLVDHVIEKTIEPPTLKMDAQDTRMFAEVFTHDALYEGFIQAQQLLGECRVALEDGTKLLTEQGAQARELVAALSKRVNVLEKTIAVLDRAIQATPIAKSLLGEDVEALLAFHREQPAP